MATNFPTSLDNFTNPSSGDLMNSVIVPHADQHANANDAIEALEAKVGVNSSSVTGSLDYKVTNTSSIDPGHKHSQLFDSTGASAIVGSNATGTLIANVVSGNSFIGGTYRGTSVLASVASASSGIFTAITIPVSGTGTGLFFSNNRIFEDTTQGSGYLIVSTNNLTVQGTLWGAGTRLGTLGQEVGLYDAGTDNRIASFDGDSIAYFYAGGTYTYNNNLSAQALHSFTGNLSTTLNATVGSSLTVTRKILANTIETSSILAITVQGTTVSGTTVFGTTVSGNSHVGGTFSGTLLSAYGSGSLLFSRAGVASGLVVGSTGQVLSIVSGFPAWTDPATGTVGGGGASTNLAYWTSTANVTGSSNLTYNGSSLVIKGNPLQAATVPLTQWQTSGGAFLAEITPQGSLSFKHVTGYSETKSIDIYQFSSNNKSAFIQFIGNGNFTNSIKFGINTNTADSSATVAMTLSPFTSALAGATFGTPPTGVDSILQTSDTATSGEVTHLTLRQAGNSVGAGARIVWNSMDGNTVRTAEAVGLRAAGSYAGKLLIRTNRGSSQTDVGDALLIDQSQDVTFYKSAMVSGNVTALGVTGSIVLATSALLLGSADTDWFRSAASTSKTNGSVQVGGTFGIGTTPPTANSIDCLKTITTSQSWTNQRNVMYINAHVSGGYSLGAVQHLVYVSSGIGSGPSNFVTAENASVLVYGGTAYVHYTVGGEFSAKTTSDRTGGTINFFAGGLFQAWLQSNPGGTFTTAYGGRFDLLSIDASTSGSVTTGAAMVARYGHFVAGAKTTFTTLAGLQLQPQVGSGSITNYYGILGDATVNNASGAVTLAKWIDFGALPPIRANSQTRIGIDIATMPVSAGFTGTVISAIRLGSGGVYDNISWGNHTRMWSHSVSALTVEGELRTTRRVVTDVVTLSDAASINTNASLGNHFRVTLGGNRSLTRPTSAYDGQKMTYEFKQDGTGSRTMVYDAGFRFGTEVASATLSTASGKVDFLTCIYTESISAFCVVGFVRGY